MTIGLMTSNLMKRKRIL